MANIINPYRFGSSGGGGSDYVTISTSATVNTDSYDYDYKYIEFDSTTTSAFEVTDAGSSSGSDSIEVYVIGGGGGGGAQTSSSNIGTGGGGGAGGFIRQTSFTNGSSLVGTYDVTIGAGGGGGSPNSTQSTSGSDSQVVKQGERSIDIATGDYFSADASSNFDLGTGDYTIEFWMKTDLSVNTSGWQLPISVGIMQLWISTGSKYLSPYWGTGSLIQTSNDVIKDDYWQHIALTRESGTTRLYVDGVHRGSATGTTNFGTSGSNKVIFGYQLYVGGGYFTMAGRFAGIRIYKGTAKYTGTSGFNPNMEKPAKETNVTLLINPDSGQSDITDSSDGSNSFTDNITWSSDLETDTPLMRAFGGGHAASYSAQYAAKGGSGGGGAYSPNAGASGFNGQGNSGGTGDYGGTYINGGGGGAGGNGSNGSSGGDGGDGWTDSAGWMYYNSLGPDSDGYFAGGGGGGRGSYNGGSGGGGSGGQYSSDAGTDGSTNSGGGGGGAGKSNGSGNVSNSGGGGGSGKIIVRWKYQN